MNNVKWGERSGLINKCDPSSTRAIGLSERDESIVLRYTSTFFPHYVFIYAATFPIVWLIDGTVLLKMLLARTIAKLTTYTSQGVALRCVCELCVSLSAL